MIDIEQMFTGNTSGRRQRGERSEVPASPPEVLCTTLREVADRYAAPCPFKPGDLVTPRKGSTYTDEGLPHIVLEVADEPIRVFGEGDADIASFRFGPRLDVRVACEMQGCIVAFWQESYQLEPYTGPGSEQEQKAA